MGNRRFPKDDEFTEAFMNQAQYGRGSTKFVLQSLEKNFNHREVIDFNIADITIEHILPQTLNQIWKEQLGGKANETQSKWLHTFGNLTLTAYNSSLSNDEFSIKKEKLKNSHLEINLWIVEQQQWTHKEIQSRAEILLSYASKIWISPI
jgi:hypothetical protein